jgi:hypothetical protein
VFTPPLGWLWLGRLGSTIQIPCLSPVSNKSTATDAGCSTLSHLNCPARRHFLGFAAAAAACFFLWFAALDLACFCEACFCTDFGDLSPMIGFLSLIG